MSSTRPIDAVITWVDGDDPVHRAKRARYSVGVAGVGAEDIGAETRFRSVGEIGWCVASIRRFAPFVRKIFVLTDGQDPHLDGVEIVDHSSVSQGFEEYFPLFNSLGIETLMWRIPGLAQRFVYFNDDVFLTAPCTPEDFFAGDKTVCYAKPFSVAFASLLRALKSRDEFGFKDAMLNAALLLGEKNTFLKTSHIPLALRSDRLAEFFTAHPEAVRSNLSCRFRERHQFNPQQLYYLLARREGTLEIRDLHDALYMKPKDRPGYVEHKIKAFREAPKARFCCLNSLDTASESDRALVTDWLDGRIGPNPLHRR